MGELQWVYEGNRRGPKGEKGDKGDNGSNVLPTSAAIVNAIQNAGPGRDAVDARVAAGTAAANTALAGRLSDAQLEAKYATRARMEDTILRADFGAMTPEGAPYALLAAGLVTPTTDVRVVCLGSSTMAGHHTTYPDQGVATRLALRAGAASLESLDALAANITANGMRWFGGAEGGTTSGTFYPAARQAKVGYVKPHYALIMVGSNDFSNQVPLATYESNVRAAIAHLKTTNAAVVCVLIHQQARGDLLSPTLKWAQYGAVLAKIAGDTANVISIDVDAYLATAQMGGNNRTGLVGIDTVHMDEVGHLLVADIIGAELGIPSETDLIRADRVVPLVIPASGDRSVSGNWISGVQIKKANYPRVLRIRGSVYAQLKGNNGAHEITAEITQTGDTPVAQAARVGDVAYAQSVGADWMFYLKPGKDATLRITIGVPTGGVLYVSGADAYTWLNYQLQRV